MALGLELDEATLAHFEAGARCLLRLRVTNESASPVDGITLHTEVSGASAIGAVTTGPIAPTASAVVSVYVVPPVAGFHELAAVLEVSLGASTQHLRVSNVPFRVAAGGPQSVVVNLDQRSARVVDNSRLAVNAGGGGGLVGDARWVRLTLQPVDHGAAAALFSAIRPPAAVQEPAGPVSFTVRTTTSEYTVRDTLAVGELSTVYAGTDTGSGARVAIKIADDPADNDLIQAELNVLAELRSVPSRQQKHLPTPLGQLRTQDGRLGTVFERLDGLDLATIRQRLPDGIPPEHLSWLARRTLSVLGWAHKSGILHGNVDPAHILVRAQDHNVWLIDWCWSVVRPAETGQGFRCVNEVYGPPEAASRRAPSPASDLYALGKTLIFAAGGDPATNALPDHVDERLQRVLRYLVVESQRGRAQDAWQLYEQLDAVREAIWGPHRFVEFIVPEH